jgi:hypothetical protein
MPLRASVVVRLPIVLRQQLFTEHRTQIRGHGSPRYMIQLSRLSPHQSRLTHQKFLHRNVAVQRPPESTQQFTRRNLSTVHMVARSHGLGFPVGPHTSPISKQPNIIGFLQRKNLFSEHNLPEDVIQLVPPWFGRKPSRRGLIVFIARED